MKDLYGVLGVAKDAAGDAVKSAYRKLAKKHHPDVGGDPEEFRALTLAYEALSDDDRRRKYDDTGDTEQPLDTTHVRALQLIGSFVDGLASQILQRDNLAQDNLVNTLRKALIDRVKDTQRARDEAQTFARRTAKLAKRFKVKKGENYIASMLETKIRGAEQIVKEASDYIELLNVAKEILADADFEVEPRPAVNTAYMLNDEEYKRMAREAFEQSRNAFFKY